MVFCFITPTYSSDMLRSHKCWFISTTTTENGRKLFECEFKEHDKSLTPKISSFYSNKIFHLEPFLAFFSLSCFLFKKSISRTSYTTVMEWWKGSRYIIIFFWAFGWLCSLHNNKYICWIKCLGIFIVLVMMGSCYWVELFEYFALLVFFEARCIHKNWNVMFNNRFRSSPPDKNFWFNVFCDDIDMNFMLILPEIINLDYNFTFYVPSFVFPLGSLYFAMWN